MEIRLIPVANRANPDFFNHTTAVVFDVLRATSSIVTALAAGYQRVYPATTKDAALTLAQRYGYVLAGERGGLKIEGFPHGNSPLEFWPGPGTAQGVGMNRLVLTTSNGTAAIQRAAGASRVLIGSLLNARAVALAALQEGRDIILVCAGSEGQFSLEDTLGAGFVLKEIVTSADTPPSMDDLAMAAYNLAGYYSQNPLTGLLASSHGQKLQKLGHLDDLHWCSQLNRFDLVPVLRGDYVA